MARTTEQLILYGKFYVIYLHYRFLKCYKCDRPNAPICKHCKENNLKGQIGWIYCLNNEEIEKIYKEIEENE